MYAQVQPVAWWLNNYITEGKKQLNFSEFAAYRIRRKYKKMEEVIDRLKDDEMPIASYTLIHRDAKLSNNQKLRLMSWASAIIDSIKSGYLADSLLKK